MSSVHRYSVAVKYLLYFYHPFFIAFTGTVRDLFVDCDMSVLHLPVTYTHRRTRWEIIHPFWANFFCDKITLRVFI